MTQRIRISVSYNRFDNKDYAKSSLQGGGHYEGKSRKDRVFVPDFYPNGQRIPSMTWRDMEVSPLEMLNLALSGYTFCHVFDHPETIVFSTHEKVKDKFKEANCIFIDVDDSPVSMWDYVKSLTIPPTIAYPSYSNGKEGKVKFRMVYFLSYPVTSEEQYQELYFGLKEFIKQELGDKHGLDDSMKSVNQCILGTYSTKLNLEQSLCLGFFHSPNVLPKAMVKKTSKGFKVDGKAPVRGLVSPGLVQDLMMSSLDVFVDSRKKDFGRILFRSNTATWDEELNVWVLPKDRFYGELFFRYDPETRKHLRFDAHRRKIVYTIGTIFHTIYGTTLTADHLLYLLCWYVRYNIDTRDWRKDSYTWKELLVSIAEHVIGQQQYFYVSPGNRVRTDKSWCRLHGVDAMEHSKKARKMLHVREVMEAWDCQFGMKKNVKLLKQMGIDISLDTVKRWKREGIITI